MNMEPNTNKADTIMTAKAIKNEQQNNDDGEMKPSWLRTRIQRTWSWIRYACGPHGLVPRQHLYLVIALVLVWREPAPTPLNTNLVRNLLILLGLVAVVLADIVACSLYSVWLNVRHPERVPLTVDRILELVIKQVQQAGYVNNANELIALRYQLSNTTSKTNTVLMPSRVEASLLLLNPWLNVTMHPFRAYGASTEFYSTIIVKLKKNMSNVTYNGIQAYGASLPDPRKTVRAEAT